MRHGDGAHQHHQQIAYLHRNVAREHTRQRSYDRSQATTINVCYIRTTRVLPTRTNHVRHARLPILSHPLRSVSQHSSLFHISSLRWALPLLQANVRTINTMLIKCSLWYSPEHHKIRKHEGKPTLGAQNVHTCTTSLDNSVV